MCKLDPGLKAPLVSKVQPNGDKIAFNLNLVSELAPLQRGLSDDIDDIFSAGKAAKKAADEKKAAEEPAEVRAVQVAIVSTMVSTPRVERAWFQLPESTSLSSRWFQICNVHPIHRG